MSKPLYLALSGGGGHAAAHAGVIDELVKAQVPIAGIAGVSGGALVAAAWSGGEPVVFREGDVREAVRASCSFPGVFPPMVVNGRRLYDGGISEQVPVSLAREMAGDGGVVLAVDCNGGTRWPNAASFVALALRAGLTLLRGRTRGELSGADLVLAPAMGDSGWMQPRKIPAFFEAGRESAREALPELRRLIAP